MSIRACIFSLLTLFLMAGIALAAVEVVVPIENASVIRPTLASDRMAFELLPEAVVIMVDPPIEVAKIAPAFSVAHARGRSAFSSSAGLFIVSTGPMLDSPDIVEIKSLVRRGNHFQLEVVHTRVRLQDTPLLRNIVWRPMAKVGLPKDMLSGKYSAQVNWQVVEKLPNGQALPVKGWSETALFEITGKDNNR